MINQKFFVLILLSLSLIGLAGFALTTGNTSSAGINTLTIEEQITGNAPLADADPSGTQTTGAQVLTLSQETGLKFSGEVVTCTNLSDSEQVIDLKISNLDQDNISINIGYPFSWTIELIPGQKMNFFEQPIPIGISSIELSSNDEKLTLQVPPCVVRGGGSSGNSQSSISSSDKDFQQPPPPVPELSTMALTGIGLFGLIFIIRGRK